MAKSIVDSSNSLASPQDCDVQHCDVPSIYAGGGSAALTKVEETSGL